MFTVEQRKRIFAQHYIADPRAIYHAAMQAWPDDPSHGLLIAVEWSNDPEVHQYCRELHDSGASALLPPKEQIVKEILELGRGSGEDADRLKAYELAAKLLGYIQPAQTNVNSKTVVHSPVMVVRDHGDLDEWEQRAKQQQKNLLSNHAERNASTTTKH